MAKCGKNKLPGFVSGLDPNQFNTDFAKIPIYNPTINNYTGILKPGILGPNKMHTEFAARIPIERGYGIDTSTSLPELKTVNNNTGGDDNNDRNPNARYTGWIPELATQAINLAAFLRHRNSDITRPDIYHHNPYETAGLSRLANLRINNYPIAKEMRDAERRGAYQIKTVGMSPGQWANQRIALALGTQNNIAKLFSNNQIQNNAYQGDWAKSALALGENTRNARMKANEYGWNQFIAAHGARELNSSKYMDAIAQTLGQGYSNWWKWNQWRDTMSRYDQAYDLENRKLKAYYGLS